MAVIQLNNRIELWLLPIPKDFTSTFSPQEIEGLLTARDTARFKNFRVATKKDEFLSARLLLRHLVSQYTSYSPDKIEAVPDEQGRPFWFHGQEKIPLYFSLSHTREMICCAVSHKMQTGCDIEQVRPRRYEKNLAEKVFSDEEMAFYFSLPEKKRRFFFYKSWTLKEAFVKAVGLGLRIPLSSLSFAHKTFMKKLTVIPSSQLGTESQNSSWHFLSLPIGTDYLVAFAAIDTLKEISLNKVQLEGRELRLISVEKYNNH